MVISITLNTLYGSGIKRCALFLLQIFTVGQSFHINDFILHSLQLSEVSIIIIILKTKAQKQTNKQTKRQKLREVK